jgi:hypothetical protein
VQKIRPAIRFPRAFSALLLAGALMACSEVQPTQTAASDPSGTNPPPTSDTVSISGTPSTSVVAGSAYSFQPSATDSAGNAVSFSIENAPTWASFSTATGALTGTPTSGQVGTYSNIMISATDGIESAALPAFTIVVTQNAATRTATLTWVAPTLNTNGTKLTDLAGYYVLYGTNAGALSQTITLPNPGANTYVVSGLSVGTWFFAVEAYDSAGNTSAPSNIASKTF